MEKKGIKSKEDVTRGLGDKTEFERNVLIRAFEIPKGRVSTYKRIAQKTGRPKAYRAVGNALHNNPLAPVVPCHRVVRSDGRIVGRKESVENRRMLLDKEGIPLKGNKVMLKKEILY